MARPYSYGTNIDVAKIRALIPECDGNVRAIAKRAGIPASTLQHWFGTQPALQAELADARQAAMQRDLFDPNPDEVRTVLLAHDGRLPALTAFYGRDAGTINRWLIDHPELSALAAELRAAVADERHIVAFEPQEALVTAALAALNGNLAAVAHQFHTTRGTLQSYLNRHPNVQIALYDAQEGMLDMAEASLYRAVLAGEAWAVIFFLKTRGRKRGYIERGESVNLNVNLNQLSVEQLERLAAGEHPSYVLASPGGIQSPNPSPRGPQPYPVADAGAGDPGPETQSGGNAPDAPGPD